MRWYINGHVAIESLKVEKVHARAACHVGFSALIVIPITYEIVNIRISIKYPIHSARRHLHVNIACADQCNNTLMQAANQGPV